MHEADFINEYSEDLNDFSEDSKTVEHKLDLEEILRVYNEYLKATKDRPKNYTTTAIGTGDTIIDRNYLDKVMKKSNINYNYGWICPRCGKVLAPDVKECTCKPEPKSNINNPFYQVVESSGFCVNEHKYSWCPQTPSYTCCHSCLDWVKCTPV